MRAAHRGHVDVFQALVVRGARTDLTNHNGLTARAMAAQQAPSGGAGLPGYTRSVLPYRVRRYFDIESIFRQAELLENAPFHALVSCFLRRGDRPALPIEIVLHIARYGDFVDMLRSIRINGGRDTRFMSAVRLGSRVLVGLWLLLDGGTLELSEINDARILAQSPGYTHLSVYLRMLAMLYGTRPHPNERS